MQNASLLKQTWNNAGFLRRILIAWMAIIAVFYVSAGVLWLFGLTFRNWAFLAFGCVSPLLCLSLGAFCAVLSLARSSKKSFKDGSKGLCAVKALASIVLAAGLAFVLLTSSFFMLFMVEEEYVVEIDGERRLAVANQFLAAWCQVDFYEYHGPILRGSESLEHYEGEPGEGEVGRQLAALRSLED